MNNSAVIDASLPRDQSPLFPPIDQTRERRSDLDHSFANLSARHRPRFHLQHAKHTELGWCQVVFAKDTTQPILKLVASAHQGQHCPLLGRAERSLPLQLATQLAFRQTESPDSLIGRQLTHHGKQTLCRAPSPPTDQSVMSRFKSATGDLRKNEQRNVAII
jgi:hypothetical protein